MKRIIMKYLLEWKKDKNRKPLIIRGARQVGKTYIVRELGKTFTNFIEINFEMKPELSLIFKDDLTPDVILQKISIAYNKKIIPNETLIFFDEIQNCPNALISLRYFYELKPEIFVIAAGSLIEFLLQKVGIPVGRVRSLYIYPMNFYEFLQAKGEEKLLTLLENHDINKKIAEIYHNKLLKLVGEYIAIGGMPEIVKTWIQNGDFQKVRRIQSDIVYTYRQDFLKYAKRQQIKYIEKIFNKIPLLLGKKFIFSHIDKTLKTRELKPALELLVASGLIHIVNHTSANGIPLGAERNEKKFKAIFVDIGLSQNIVGNNAGHWILNPLNMIINKGGIAEAFVGQELISYNDPFIKKNLFYWIREKRGATAEVDYIETINNKIYPIEVKSGMSNKSKSIKIFMKEKKIKHGIRFSQKNFFIHENIINMPIYSILKLKTII